MTAIHKISRCSALFAGKKQAVAAWKQIEYWDT